MGDTEVGPQLTNEIGLNHSHYHPVIVLSFQVIYTWQENMLWSINNVCDGCGKGGDGSFAIY